MKKFIIPVLVLVISTLTYGQIKVFKTTHLNIGFGRFADVQSNKFMTFCVNGPLVKETGYPVGGYVDNDTIKQSWTDPESGGGNFEKDNCIFGITKTGKLIMLEYSAKDSLPPMKWAIQNGPALVRNGLNVRGTSTTKYQRSGIGYTRLGEIVVIVSVTPVTFWEFADLFVQQGCWNAIYLDGGPAYVGYADKNEKYGFVNEATKLQFFNN